jgi:hypothetical protein
MMVTTTLLSAGAIIFFYLLASNRIIAVAHPLRMAISNLADNLCEDHEIPDAVAARVDNLVDHMYSGARAWLYTVLMPAAMVLGIYRKITGLCDASLDCVPAKKRPAVQVITGLAFISTLLNSPLAALLFVIQFLIYVILFLPIGSLLAELLAMSTSIENVELSIRSKHLHGHA